MADQPNIFERFGIPIGAFARIKGGRGVVGRTTHLMMVAVVVLGAIGWRLSDPIHLMIAGGAIIVFVTVVIGVLLWWAQNNPQLAVMEGLDLAAYKTAEAAALGIPRPPTTPAIADPGTITANLCDLRATMPRFFHVGFNFAGPPKVKELEGAFSASGDWLRYSNNCWVVWTERSALDIYNTLKPYLVDQDQFLILEVNTLERSGWLPEWIWNWINARQQYQANALTGFGGLASLSGPSLGVAPPNPFLPPPNPFFPSKK